MNMGFFAQITQMTIQLVTSNGPVFLSLGMTEFRTIAIILVIWEGYKVAFQMQPANRIAGLLVSIAITYSALVFYASPFPGTSSNLTQTVTDEGVSLANQIDTATGENVAKSIATVMGNMSGTSWNIITNSAASVRYFIIEFALSAMEIAMLGIIAFGFVAVGILVLIGPVLIPFFLVPGFDWLAMGWFRSLIQYSFYPVVGQAFIYVYGNVWLNFFAQMSGPMDSQLAAGLMTQIVVLSLAGVFGILKVPQLVAGIFAGSSGISALPGVGWWK